jgi:hypothetical protein
MRDEKSIRKKPRQVNDSIDCLISSAIMCEDFSLNISDEESILTVSHAQSN